MKFGRETMQNFWRKTLWLLGFLMFTGGCRPSPEALHEQLNERLSEAVRHWEIEDAKAAIDAGADVNALVGHYKADSAEKIPLLSMALERGDVANARLLLERGADANKPDSDGEPPLLYALKQDKVDEKIMRAILSQNPDVNVRARPQGGPTKGESALMFCVQPGRTVWFGEMLKRGADVNVRNDQGRSALTIAAASGNEATVKALLVRGAKDVKDDNGRTALSSAQEHGHANIVRFLQKANAKADAKR